MQSCDRFTCGPEGACSQAGQGAQLGRGDLGNLPPDQKSVKQSIELLTLRKLIGCSHLRSMANCKSQLFARRSSETDLTVQEGHYPSEACSTVCCTCLCNSLVGSAA